MIYTTLPILHYKKLRLEPNASELTFSGEFRAIKLRAITKSNLKYLNSTFHIIQYFGKALAALFRIKGCFKQIRL